MKNNSLILGFVGVIGSGKSHAILLEELQSIKIKADFIKGDFSDGVRDGVMRILANKKGTDIDINSMEYRAWKEVHETISTPLYELNRASGRELLTRYGSLMKELCGGDVWAQWTKKDVLAKLLALENHERYLESNIAFGSIRYLCEAKILFELEKSTGKKVIIRFMDFKSGEYNATFDHESEYFAQHLLELGCTHMQDITSLIKEMIDGEGTL